MVAPIANMLQAAVAGGVRSEQGGPRPGRGARPPANNHNNHSEEGGAPGRAEQRVHGAPAPPGGGVCLPRLTDTLVVDADGVYDLADINDRLLLGLKGTMSEAELHILASRMDQSKRAAAARGELRLPLAAGFVHDDDGAVIIDPDQEVQ